MSVTNRRRAPSDPQNVLFGFGFAALALVAGVSWAALRAGYWWDGHPDQLPDHPVTLLTDMVKGSIPWTPACVTFAVFIVAALALVAVLVLAATRRIGRRPAIDKAARELGHGRALRPLTVKAAAKKARRLGVEGFAGHVIGPTVADGQDLVSDVEAGRLTFAGPRTGKTTSWGIPEAMDAPGFLVATGNKGDLTNATRDYRATRGPVYVFDPMGIVGEPCSWYWDPITYVTNEITAQRLAALIASASRPPNAKGDDYFGPEGVTLLGNLLLAAAVDDRPITQVYLWATSPADAEPARLLADAGYELPAAALRGVIDAPSKERGGIYGGVRRSLSFLLNGDAVRWITPDPTGARRPFDPHRFVRGDGSLYLLSREGIGSTGPMVLALTVAVTDAAEAYARQSEGERLPVPATFVLDEAANIVRWPDLPDLYSHYGSKGILMDTILQSPAQGERVWGKDGLAQLVASSTVMIYGGGVRDVEFLGRLAQLVGHYRPTQASTTSSKSGWSTSRSTVTELALDVSDLTDLAPTRAMVFSYGTPATLIRKVPWMGGRHDKAIRASLAAHDPATTPAAREPDVPSPAELRTTNPWKELT